ncbi:unnamed protein product [Porites evermanni]|uniref:Uncharacterized protein n=1 Tax=Porites evermanni TaxID=104178 RepID=A0ABN8MLZ6_9CNID|nr:unnamed protein product [Porites evermanni]
MLSSEIINCYLHGIFFRKIASRASAKALVSQNERRIPIEDVLARVLEEHVALNVRVDPRRSLCRNKPGGDTGRHPISSNRRPHSYQIESRPSEEKERVRENNDVKEFIQTLDEPMVRKLCIRSLRRGVGSMDFIQGALDHGG